MEVPASAIEVTCYHTWQEDDGVVRTKVKPGADVTLKEAKENSDAVNSFYYGEKFPLMIDARGIRSMTREARSQFSLKGRNSGAKAFAIVIDSSISKVVGNFFMGLNKPEVPARLFTDEDEALKWLKQIGKV